MRSLWVLALLLSSCTRLGFDFAGDRPTTDANTGDAPITPDSVLDGTLDLGPRRDGPRPDRPEACSPLTADGLFLNPGCDPDVQTSGLTIVAHAPVVEYGRWAVLNGPKWWIYEPGAAGADGAFVEGGRDLAATLRQLGPACSATNEDGFPLNPGCDAEVQATGLTSMVTITDGAQGVWILSQGKKWWVYDPTPETGPAAFVAAGDDIAAYLQQLPIDCTQQTSTGVFKNPGCDPAVQSSGLTSMGFFFGPQGDPLWFATRDTRWWLYEVGPVGSGTFVDAGPQLRDLLLQFKPDCSQTGADRTMLNPGCDPEVVASGFTDADMIPLAGGQRGLVVRGTKWWIFEPAADLDGSAFVDAGADVASFLRGLLP